MLGQTIKKKFCFRSSGWVSQKVATGNFFFHICKKENLKKMDNIFLPNLKKILKKKEIAAARLATITANRLDQKQKSYLVWPYAGQGLVR